MKLNCVLVVGTRPQIIKSSLLIREAKKHDISFLLIHTGQHYDYSMSQEFFEEFDLSEPDLNLGVGSGAPGYQVGTTIIRLEKALANIRSPVVLIPGDTNSALAGALTAAKMNLPVAHIEAGCRSFDMRMPEEVNRVLVDHMSSLLFAPSKVAANNLAHESVPGEVHLTGDTMYDIFLQHKNRIAGSRVTATMGLRKREYIVLTLHRAENTADPAFVSRVLDTLASAPVDRVVFPIHPRTKKALDFVGSHRPYAKRVRIVEPLGYADMLALVSQSRMLVTDSGGLQKEAFWLGVPCITLRSSTEWPETLKGGLNVLVGRDFSQLKNEVDKRLHTSDSERETPLRNPYGDGTATKRILNILEGYVERSR